MGFFGNLMKTVIDVATIPLDIATDVVTLGGAINDSDSKIANKFGYLKDDIEDMSDDIRSL